ncbi:hypothetical protein [Clostridium gasigenes]|uniref:ABC-2 family transporter protein n=1 Tax=Clostridium gasigenes TaxID=94869 RepID=A0A1H0LMD5_9CLOT|nr:hypothetical protein [Clostridium gasigenes]MBB6622452.1 hypothetical protein [Clostridium gasigenes]MBU3087224.1 hypothetical protein [Clostridium gasigenes]MBU3130968.1 hypothetical protein [Clostridium gasigenes]NKF07254.1 hypothetical protein [Clostridium gasigenes]QSW18231.1 hypothetical protein J1C67_11725 [Clostridium gasigenes]
MLADLLKYELTKKWRSMRYIVLAYGLIEIILLCTLKIASSKSDMTHLFTASENKMGNLGFMFITGMIFYFIFILILTIMPFIEAIIKYEKDLAGKQSPLELMIPAESWKKILSKLITAVCGTIICGIIAIASVIIFFLVMSNFEENIVDLILRGLSTGVNFSTGIIFIIISGFFEYISIFTLFFFCIAISKWITHKKKTSDIISVFVLAGAIAVIYFLQIQVDKLPIATFTLYGINTNLSAIILDILIFIILFIGTSFIMERKIEN